jgi:peptide/nickel transport system permease protein
LSIQTASPGRALGREAPEPRPAALPRFVRRVRRWNGKYVAATLILGPIIALALLAPYLPISDPIVPNPTDSLQSPSLEHPFGTDRLGRDIFSRTLGGARISLLVGFSAAAIALVTGITLGTMAGFMGRSVDAVMSSVTDILMSFPSILLVLAIVATFGNGLTQIIIAIAVADAPRAVRLQRALALGIRSRSFIDASRMASSPLWWVLLRHVLPNTIAPMVVVGSIYAANAILVEASLSFLGLGVVPPEPSWGNIINEGRPYLEQAWWISTFPGLAIALVAFSLHLLSDGLRQNLDPRLAS